MIVSEKRYIRVMTFFDDCNRMYYKERSCWFTLLISKLSTGELFPEGKINLGLLSCTSTFNFTFLYKIVL